MSAGGGGTSAALLADRYRLRRQIGSGGMAEVYEADDTSLGRPVAIKMLNARHAADEAFVARFQAEARAIARLKHPCIVNVYDVGREGDRNFIVMELVPGRTLKDVLHDGPLSIDQTINIGVQVAQALEHAHGAGIVHRDVKAQNVLVGADGSAKLVDFGIASMLNASPDRDSGPVLGTVHYLAPERARGEAATAATDLYSFGVVLYEMATGRVPFEAENPADVARKHLSEAPIPPSALNPATPSYLEKAILWALAKDPRDRPPTAGELARQLLQFDQMQHESTRVMPLSRPESPPTSPMPWASVVRRRESSSWPLLLLFLVALGLFLGLIPLWTAIVERLRP